MERYQGAMAAGLGQVGGAIPDMTRNTLDQAYEKQREQGSVERELGRLSEAVMMLEQAVSAHVSRIAPVILNVPQTPNGNAGKAEPPDPVVCNVAEGTRTLRRRIEEITGALALVTSRVDL